MPAPPTPSSCDRHSRQRFPCRFLGCKSIVELIGKPFDLFVDMLLRLLHRGAARDQEAFHLNAPVDQRQGFLVELLFLCHCVTFIKPAPRFYSTAPLHERSRSGSARAYVQAVSMR